MESVEAERDESVETWSFHLFNKLAAFLSTHW